MSERTDHGSRYRVLCVYGFKRRDGFPVILLKFYLERFFNCRVTLVKSEISTRIIDELLAFYKPQVVVLLNIQLDSQKKIVLDAPRLGYRVVLMPSEIMASVKTTGQRFLLNNKAVYEGVSLYCAPGKKVQSFLIDNGIFSESQVPITGYPRYDMYAKPFARFWGMSEDAFRRKLNLREGVPVVLWASNNRYPQINKPGMREFYVADTEKNLKIDGRKRIDTYVRSHEESVRLVGELAQSLGKRCYILYRMRQGEDVDGYRRMWHDVENLRLVHDEALLDLLPYSGLVFHGFSMVGVEAWFFGKPTVSFCFSGLEEYYIDAYRGCEDVVTDRKQLFDYVDTFLSNRLAGYEEKYRQGQHEHIKDWYYAVDGKATWRVAQRIHALLSQGRVESSFKTQVASAVKLRLKHLAGFEDFESFLWFRNRHLNTGHNLDRMIYRRDVEGMSAWLSELAAKGVLPREDVRHANESF